MTALHLGSDGTLKPGLGRGVVSDESPWLFDLDLEPWFPRPGDRWPWLDIDGGAGITEDEPTVGWGPRLCDEIVRRLSGRFGDPYTDLYLVLMLVGSRLRWARRSTDPVTMSLAMAAFQPSGSSDIPDAGRSAGRQAAPSPRWLSQP